MKKAIALACAAAAHALVCGAATVTETEVELATYPFFDPDPVPATDNQRYPYFFFDGTSATNAPRKWEAVILENDKIRVTILPEIGGKIWGATDKATGRDFIYYNNVVKFRNVARRGPWCSGGVEFNFGIYGHTHPPPRQSRTSAPATRTALYPASSPTPISSAAPHGRWRCPSPTATTSSPRSPRGTTALASSRLTTTG